MKEASATVREYTTLDEAYGYFNRELFENTLPACLITYQRKANTKGHFSANRFVNRRDDTRLHELAMNPNTFLDRTVEEILSTLVHEMVHLWQQEYGTPSRRGYHNRQWADKMLGVGLVPSVTGRPEGKQTGQSVTHFIQEGGPFESACGVFLAAGRQLEWGSMREKPQPGKSSKMKYLCSKCGLACWAKPDANLICGDCFAAMSCPARQP